MDVNALPKLQDRGVFSPLDVSLAQGLARLVGEKQPDVLLAIALASRALRLGHVCAHLARCAPLLDDAGQPVDIELPELASWLTTLRASPLVGTGSERRPVLLGDDSRLYLYRYAAYERQLAASIRRRASVSMEVDDALLKAGLARLFPGRADDRQREAARIAVSRAFCVISGGPGTGKTSTVVKILALLQEQALVHGGQLRIELLAPTGKAAQRMHEAIERGVAQLDTRADVKQRIPNQAATIHRALGFRPEQPTRFRHDAGRPLSADVVVVDEASMVDLALMAKLFDAVRHDARIILLGDKNQLASVEAGAILGDIFAASVDAASGGPEDNAIGECMIHLTKSYRFGDKSGIGALASAIQQGDSARAMAVLRGDEQLPYGEVQLSALDDRAPLAGALGRCVAGGFADMLGTRDPQRRLAELAEFRVLCVHRRGPLGVEALNEAIEQLLGERALLQPRGVHYDGRPIMITRNDYQLELFNGDVGVMVETDDGMRAHFASGEGMRSFRPARLPPHETVFAMTVHKSQGSEFNRVAVVLPSHQSPIVTRELLYTAVTRARKRVDVFAEPALIADALGRRIERASGLREALLRVEPA